MKKNKLIRPLTSIELAKEIKLIACQLGIKQKEVRPEHFKIDFQKKKEEGFKFKL